MKHVFVVAYLLSLALICWRPIEPNRRFVRNCLATAMCGLWMIFHIVDDNAVWAAIWGFLFGGYLQEAVTTYAQDRPYRRWLKGR